jgi:hypothetical protein
MSDIAPLLIVATVGVVTLGYWLRYKDADARREAMRSAAKKMSQETADRVIREATRRLRPTSLIAGVLVSLVLGALGLQAAKLTGFDRAVVSAYDYIAQGAKMVGLGPGPGVGRGGGRSRDRAGGSGGGCTYGAPNAPTVSIPWYGLNGDSVGLRSSAFNGTCDDTQDSINFDVDSVGADWSTPVFTSTLGAVLTDTATSLIAATQYKVRARVKGAAAKSALWSDYGDSTVFTTDDGSGLYPNIPANMSLITQWDGTSATAPSGWTGNLGGCGSVEADGVTTTNPLGTGSSLRIDYVTGLGTQCGNGPVINWGLGYDTLYVMYRIYIDPNWEEAHGQKLAYVFQNGGTSTTAYYVTREANKNLLVSGNLGGPVYITATGLWTGARGTWVTIETIWYAETTYNSSDDAAIYVYKNGTLVGSNTSPDVMGDLNGLEWYLARNDSHSQSEFFLIGEFSAWGK